MVGCIGSDDCDVYLSAFKLSTLFEMYLLTIEPLPGILGNKGTGTFIFREQGYFQILFREQGNS